MKLRSTVAETLYKRVVSGKMPFHTALKLFRLVAMHSVRHRSKSGRHMMGILFRNLMEANSPESTSVWTSVLFPAEILHVFGIYPITLEVIAGFLSSLGLATRLLDKSDAAGVPPTMCSFHRTLIQLSREGLLKRPIAIGATSIMCDGNVKSFAEAAKTQDVPFIFIDVPFEEGDEGVTYVRDQLEAAVDILSDATGTRLSDEKLAEVVSNANRAFWLARRRYELNRTSRKNLYQGSELANFAFPMHYLLGSPPLIDILNSDIEDLESGNDHNRFFKSRSHAGDVFRIMWLHIVPQHESQIWGIIDDGEKARVVCDEYSSPYFENYDPADPLGSIAKRLIGHPSNGPIERRIGHILKIAHDFNVDGIIHYSSWGCHQAAGNVQILSKEIQGAGYKFLNLSGDPVDPRNSGPEQMRTRLEAFLGN